MKEKLLISLSLLLLALPMITVIQPVRADTVQWSWINPAYKGIDTSYGSNTNIVGYVASTNWTLMVFYENSHSYPINVSAVRVYFSDLGMNYTWSYSTPVQILPSKSNVFNVYNMTPSTQVAPEQWTHTYTIYVNMVNSTNQPHKSLTPTTFGPYSDFAVLSKNHLACLNLLTQIDTYSGMQGFPTNLTRVNIQMYQAGMEFSQGNKLFGNKMYDSALTYLQNSENLFNQSLVTWGTTGTAMENATINYKNNLGIAAMNTAYGWMFFGLGWILIGLGVIIYGARRPKAMPAQSPPAPA